MSLSSEFPDSRLAGLPFKKSSDDRSLQNDISPRRPLRASVDYLEEPTIHNYRSPNDASMTILPPPHSLSALTNVDSTAHEIIHHGHGDVRTLPPWIDSFEGDDDDFVASGPTDVLLTSPPHAHSAQHHYAPLKLERRRSQDGYVDSDDGSSGGTAGRSPERGFFGGAREPDKGRKWDHARQGDPVILQAAASSPWRTFVKSTTYGPALDEDARRFDESFLEEQTPGYIQPWRGDTKRLDSEKTLGVSRRKIRQTFWFQRIQHVILMHPLVPLFFRLVVLATSIVALGFSCSIYHLTNGSIFSQNPSTIMAIIVDVVAIPYICYITWDEYTGKPLGLRSARAKIRLVLLDLFFIVFESANLAVALRSLADENGVCEGTFTGIDYDICSRAKGLCAFLFIALVSWILTFNVSILRLIHRVGGDRDDIQ